MFKKVLVANRGEIAVQIIRALHEMKIEAVAVYSVADEDSLFVQMADEAICIGDAQPQKSYLNMQNIVSAANLTGCDAIHPGYGFLSENAEFAQLCADCQINFIGPSPEVIELMGNKSKARSTMKDAGVPVIPGSDGMLSGLEEAKQVASKIGYPVMLKAADGGGGKGIRRIQSEMELEKAFVDAKREAQTSFGNADLYLEKIIEDAKHIEMQVMADKHGNAIYLPERDCSLQRSNQKLVEESPCVLVNEDERSQMGKTVIQAVHHLNYYNTGTFEFLMDSDHNFYFMEMNTRLQVEHTVTEEVTGLELIKMQIQVANGDQLEVTQDQVKIDGHAIEVRINAENPAQNFQPSPGILEDLFLPIGTLGVRIDSGVKSNSIIPPFYDSMIAKCIVHMPSRKRATTKMARLLTELSVAGVKTNQFFLHDLIEDAKFETADFNTKYVEDHFLKEWQANAK
ncbi:acetyl-CoA carboxylase biotin carboxylase subunit [Pediococcus claussenii]|uniref:Biotin carboxylase n=1 Tax=Pediococcus claussenii (strain ATCC BAA-344 / DSM 14800 / JCM 18046 / KCTC 3811 / LMG 21948 / P06) TaxID=701521 RepID=G8PER0_PEDCP|nr:acetyl-CoA carboxylase biotin carboxylase subunit [Pediococcus claussenii]AEV94440.1 acetyl-CoA carboxylase, biotin carboxylase subunit [Pediococcus claussenii ATCC BAA-344]ANZ69658.1 acetyl-CoA carboxylase biotin carboxylase subunit [Pediococcus claussenii]ANZ71475.1 acetyl-CoA carboxylase biotin carboxylase subunit [Pediococcus claussenii]KRN19856.1 accC protein [Pediococcus claussenii]